MASQAKQGALSKRISSKQLWKKTLLQSQVEGLEPVILCSLAASGDVDGLRSLIRDQPDLDVSKSDYDARTPLHLAAEEGHLEVVQLLVENGARLNCIDKFGSTPLRGAMRARKQEVVDFLKSKGATLYLETFSEQSERAPPAFSDNELEHLRVIFNSIDPSKAESSHTISDDSLRKWLKSNTGFKLKKHLIVQAELSKLEGAGGEEMSWRRFLHAMKKPSIVTKAFKGELAIPNWATFQKTITDLFNHIKATVPATSGKKASYIPELDLVDANTFGCAVCTVDGQMLTLGSEEEFSLQASVFPVLYAQLVEKMGYAAFHSAIGKEPSGAYYNSISLNSENKPHNALVNTGAIAMCRMYEPDVAASSRFKELLRFASSLASAKLGFSQTVYLSEKAAGMHNYAMAHYMASKGAISSKKSEIQDAMDFFFQLCSIETNCEKLASIAATFANNGINPLTGDRIIGESTVKQTTALLHSCGMYIASGEWACNVGLPSKSGISGNIWLIVPGVCGIAIFAPPVDLNGTSVRGAKLAQAIANRFSWNIFDVLHSAASL